MDELALEVRGLRKSFFGVPVLKGLDFQVRHGEFLGLAGINGAGKSTFLKCMLDFCHYESGEISLYGVPTRESRARSRIAFLPERFMPPYYLTGHEFVALMMELQSLPYDGDKVAGMFDELDLDRSALRKPARTFSKGMTQKLGLAACFVAERDCYVFDEPMSGLDPKARALVKRQFQKLRDRNATLIFTSHALADIDEVCERMVVLDQGVARFEGTPHEMLGLYPEAGTLEEAYLRCIQARPGGAGAPAEGEGEGKGD